MYTYIYIYIADSCNHFAEGGRRRSQGRGLEHLREVIIIIVTIIITIISN